NPIVPRLPSGAKKKRNAKSCPARPDSFHAKKHKHVETGLLRLVLGKTELPAERVDPTARVDDTSTGPSVEGMAARANFNAQVALRGSRLIGRAARARNRGQVVLRMDYRLYA